MFIDNMIYGSRVELIDEIARLHADIITMPAYKLHQVRTHQPVWKEPYDRNILKDKEIEEVRQTLRFMRDLYLTFSGTRDGGIFTPQQRKRRR